MPSAVAAHSVQDALSPVEQLAVAYAPARLRPAWTALLALEHRLADAAREGRDPIMIQLRLAWWRDRFAEAPAQWPQGEPLLAILTSWQTELSALTGLVDGWEAKNVGEDSGAALKRARVAALVALARMGGVTDQAAVKQTARDWIEDRREEALPRLPRAMRPLVILRGMELRGDAGSPLGRFLTLLRLGVLGR